MYEKEPKSIARNQMEWENIRFHKTDKSLANYETKLSTETLRQLEPLSNLQ